MVISILTMSSIHSSTPSQFSSVLPVGCFDAGQLREEAIPNLNSGGQGVPPGGVQAYDFNVVESCAERHTSLAFRS